MMFVREARKAGYQSSSDKLMSDMSLIELCNMFRCRDDTVSAMSGRDDVIFLYLVHGRNENVANSDQIIGCCVAECPLRIQLEKTMSIADLTGLIQKQAMSSTSHAHLGPNTISTRCTDWPSKETIYHHSSFVLHQTVIAKDHIVMGDTGYIDVGEPEVEHKLTYDFDLKQQLATLPSLPRMEAESAQ
jgi:hypothetical protein